MKRLIARGKFLLEDERKFFARGVSYGPFAPNSRGERFPEPGQAAHDLALMRELGANVIRTYYPPPRWLLEAAARTGLRFLAGIPWPSHMAFLDSRALCHDIRNAIRTSVAELRRFSDAIFAYNLGNEIRSDIVRWHGPRTVSRFLAELFEIGKGLDPDGLFTYSNYPSTEYLELGFLDFVSFNVYLHREADFRRYLTHLMAISGERPLVLSETGMDTVRERAERQAELLGWQARAAFEMGLSGFIVFAFTDEWFTGGAAITDWAFGLVTEGRARKPAFATVSRIFNGQLPPPLSRSPKVSIVVAARNAATTLGDCLTSLDRLTYPDYETIVVDDGSTDDTARIAQAAGVRTVSIEHRGLAAARNVGIDSAGGEIVAFIDADAVADCDWLYHLVESLTRRHAGAAGGPNLASAGRSALALALAAAPGLPREVRGGDDRLSQLCGCNMAVEKPALAAVGGFDPVFTRAGDDVDLSFRLSERGELLAHAPGAVVIHKRRATIRAYLAQQRGYGGAEGLLYRKYPNRRERAVLYGHGASWLTRWFGGAQRVYYGAFGRAPFQSVYPSRDLPLVVQTPLSAGWVATAIALVLAGMAVSAFGVLGWIGIALTLTSAIASAMAAAEASTHLAVRTRALLVLLHLLGPIVRSYERERVRLRFQPRVAVVPTLRRLLLRGTLVFSAAGAGAAHRTAVLDEMRGAMLRYGLTVARTDGFEPYDLQVLIPPGLRVALNALEAAGAVRLRFKLGLDGWPILGRGLGLAIVLLLAIARWWLVIALLAIVALGTAVLVLKRVRIVPAILRAAADETGAALGLRVEADGEQP